MTAGIHAESQEDEQYQTGERHHRSPVLLQFLLRVRVVECRHLRFPGCDVIRFFTVRFDRSRVSADDPRGPVGGMPAVARAEIFEQRLVLSAVTLSDEGVSSVTLNETEQNILVYSSNLERVKRIRIRLT